MFSLRALQLRKNCEVTLLVQISIRNLPWFTGKIDETLHCHYWKFPAVSPMTSYESHLSCHTTFLLLLWLQPLWKDFWNLPTALLLLLVVGQLPTHTISPPKCMLVELLAGVLLQEFCWQPTKSPSIMLCYSTCTLLKSRPHSVIFVLKQDLVFLTSHRKFLFLVAGTFLVPNK